MSSGMSEEISRIKRYWLNTQGGRTFSDVKVDLRGEYVEMLDHNQQEEKVYIPNNNELREIYANRVVEQTEDLMKYRREKENPSLEE